MGDGDIRATSNNGGEVELREAGKKMTPKTAGADGE